MASTIKLKDAVLLEFKKKSTKKGTLSLRCALTDEIKAVGDWGDLPDWMESGSPVGDLAAILLQVKPKDKELAIHAFELTTSRVHGFVITRVEPKGKNAKSKGKDTVVSMKIEFSDPEGARKIESYINSIGDTKSSAVVSYTKQEVLGLPGPTASEEQKESTGPQYDLVDPDGVVQ